MFYVDPSILQRSCNSLWLLLLSNVKTQKNVCMYNGMLNVHCNKKKARIITMWNSFQLRVFAIALINNLMFTITNHCTWKSCLITAAPLCWRRARHSCKHITSTWVLLPVPKLQWLLLIQEPVSSLPLLTIFTWVHSWRLCIKGVCFQY